MRPTHPLPPPTPAYGSIANFAWCMSKDGGWNGGRAGPVGPCRRPCKLGGFRPGRREVPPHQEILGYTVATTLEHQRSGRRVALEVGGAADLGGLTSSRPLRSTPPPPSSPRAGLLSGHGGVLHARQAGTWGCGHPLAGTHARVCTPTHTRYVHKVGHAPALTHSLAFRASWSLGVRADAPLCAPAPLTAWLARGVSPYDTHTEVTILALRSV